MSGHKTWRNIFRFHAQARPDGKSPRRTLTPQSAAQCLIEHIQYSEHILRAHTSSVCIESQLVMCFTTHPDTLVIGRSETHQKSQNLSLDISTTPYAYSIPILRLYSR